MMGLRAIVLPMTALSVAAGGIAAGSIAARGTKTTPAAPEERQYSESSAVQQDMSPPYDGLFHFARIAYTAGGRGGFGGGRGRGRGGAMWAHDYPRADRNFLAILQETTYIQTERASSNVLTLADPDLFKYPVTYIVEPGAWNPTDPEVEALGSYLRKGGFLIVDDFRGPRELRNLEFHLDRALPELDMMEVDENDEIFDSFFRITPSDVVPPYGGYPGAWYGIYEDNDRTKRIMVMINANNDMAEYWEFSDRGYYAIDLSNEAYKLGVNYIIYAMTH